jgi:hypothetical protein
MLFAHIIGTAITTRIIGITTIIAIDTGDDIITGIIGKWRR